jgi:hypothetical protein
MGIVNLREPLSAGWKPVLWHETALDIFSFLR